LRITPQNDGTLEALLTFLKTYLNNQSEKYYTDISQPVQMAVNGLDSIQSDLSSVLKFPLLMGYRTSLSGDLFEFSQANLDYFLLVNAGSRLKQDAMFTWVAKHIAIALDDYNSMDEGCLKITGKDSASIRYAQVRGKSGPLTIPFLRIPFQFEDFDKPA
jgi:hypothetical protein